MIELIPSIIIINGKCAKLTKGDPEQITIYDRTPLDIAQEFEDHGIRRLHLIDLDGAKKRTVVNHKVLEIIAKHTHLAIDFSGGITTDSDVRTAFSSGARYVTAATVAIEKKQTFASWLITYGREKIILAADALDGVVLTKGWLQKEEMTLMDHVQHYYDRGIKYIKSTEIARDGTLVGPNFALYKQLVDTFANAYIIACGGIRSVEDIEKLEEIGVSGIIFGRAYYEGKISLKDLTRFVEV